MCATLFAPITRCVPLRSGVVEASTFDNRAAVSRGHPFKGLFFSFLFYNLQLQLGSSRVAAAASKPDLIFYATLIIERLAAYYWCFILSLPPLCNDALHVHRCFHAWSVVELIMEVVTMFFFYSTSRFSITPNNLRR